MKCVRALLNLKIVNIMVLKTNWDFEYFQSFLRSENFQQMMCAIEKEQNKNEFPYK